jgi:hypothetical protein
MKKTITIIIYILLISGISVKAQTEKGRYFYAGSNDLGLTFGGEKTNNNGTIDDASKVSYFDFNFTQRMGYTVINNLVAGLFFNLDLYSHVYKEDGNYSYKQATFIIGPFARYYFPISDKFMPYVEGQVGFGFDNYKSRYYEADDWTKYNEGVFTYRLGGGATYFFNDFIGADIFLGFNHESYKHKGDESEASRSSHYEKVIYNEFMMQLGIVVMMDK